MAGIIYDSCHKFAGWLGDPGHPDVVVRFGIGIVSAHIVAGLWIPEISINRQSTSARTVVDPDIPD